MSNLITIKKYAINYLSKYDSSNFIDKLADNINLRLVIMLACYSKNIIAKIKDPVTVIISQYKEIFKALINLLSLNNSK